MLCFFHLEFLLLYTRRLFKVTQNSWQGMLFSGGSRVKGVVQVPSLVLGEKRADVTLGTLQSMRYAMR